MADISKITLPNGQQYSIKDQTARNTGKVSGVKGGKELGYRTGNVNLTPENIGAYPRQNYDRGTLDVGIRPLVNSTRANRLVFLPASQIIIEKTVDGGATWEDAGYADSSKVGLFSENGFSINIPLLNGKKSTLCGLRVIITGMNYDVPSGTAETEKYAYWNKDYVISSERYFNVREWWFWLSANNDTIKPSIYCATGANPNNWINVFTTDFGMTGWSGSDWIRAGDGKTFGGGVTGNYWNWKLEFYSRPTDVNMASGTFISDTIQSIYQIKCYGDNIWNSGNGGNLGFRDHLYSWDNNRNAIFPAAITATRFNGSLNGNATTATNANKVNNHTVNSDVPSDAVFTDTTDLGSMTGSLTVDHLSPIMSKTFTGIIGTANYDVDCTFFFGTIKPISYYDIWKIKYRIKVHITGTASTYNQYAQAKSEATWFGSENTYQAYHHLNHIHNTSYRPVYYNTLYSLKKAGVDAGLGHALGIGLRNSWKAYDASYPRQVTIQILQCENCQFAFLDNMVKWTSLPDFNTTNYQTYRQTDFAANGLQETGDANDVNYQNRLCHTNGVLKAYAEGGRYTLTFTKNQNYVLPITATDNLISGEEKVYTTESFNPFGEIYYRYSSSSIAANANIGNSTLFRQIIVDARYSFTGILNDTNSIMSAGNTVYLVCQPQSDGFVKLATNPLAFELPQVEDGLYYILLGYAYNTYQFELLLHHPVFMFKNGAVREVSGYSHYAGDANTVTGHTVNSNVPANAEFTDTVTTATTVGSGNAVTAISASNGALTVAKDTIFATKQESQNHVVASTTQPEGQVAGDIWLVIQE